MKTLVKTLYAVAILALLQGTLACNHTNEATVDPQNNSKIQTNQTEYERLMGARTATKGAPFDITNVSRSATSLQIQVKGGCSVDDYKVVWDGRVLLSYPQIVNLVVANEQEAGSCTTAGAYTVNVDLKQLLGANYNPADFQIQVANGSKIQDKLIDEKGVVSNK